MFSHLAPGAAKGVVLLVSVTVAAALGAGVVDLGGVTSLATTTQSSSPNGNNGNGNRGDGATPPSKSLTVTGTSFTGIVPGSSRAVTVTVTNSDAGDVVLQSITGAVRSSTLPASCLAADFTVAGYQATSAAPGPTLKKKGGSAVRVVHVVMADTADNQNACKDAEFQVDLTATGTSK